MDEALGLDFLGDLAEGDLAQSLDERLRGQVDEHDLVGIGEHAVGDGLADADAGELADGIVEALEVLDVERR